MPPRTNLQAVFFFQWAECQRPATLLRKGVDETSSSPPTDHRLTPHDLGFSKQFYSTRDLV